VIFKSIVLLIVVPFFWIYERQKPFVFRSRFSTYENLFLGVFNLSFIFFLSFALNFVWPEMDPLSTNSVTFLVTVLLLDAYTYFWHRLVHTFSLLWRFHKVHHSDMALESTSAFRFHFVEVGLSFLLRSIVLRLLGLPVLAVVVYEAVFQFMNVLQHSNLQFPEVVEKTLSRLFVTPALHRKHHDVILSHQRTNYSTVLSLWDQMFNTYCENSADQIKKFGLENQREPWSVKELFFSSLK
jgi:sterol desaturase/sphingolipid hydroxylase (fatty acid hydroxylase superfamily)